MLTRGKSLLFVLGVSLGCSLSGNDFEDLGLPGKVSDGADADLFIEEESDIKVFRGKLDKIVKWSARSIDLSSRFQKMYNERVESAANLLRKISKSVADHSSKELQTLRLDKDARALELAFKATGLRSKRQSSSVKLGAKAKKKKKAEDEEVEEEAMSLEALQDFTAPLKSTTDKIAVTFVIEEKLRFLEKLGYPKIKDDAISPVERFCDIYNRFYRRDLFVLIGNDKVGEVLVDYAKTDAVLLDHYAGEIIKLQEKGVVPEDVDFKRTAHDVRTTVSGVTRGRVTAEMMAEYLFYYEYLNDLFCEHKLVEKIPEVNFKTILSTHNKNRKKK